MDGFLLDLFDQPGVCANPFMVPDTGALSHESLLADPRLTLNAAFRFAWKQLSGGALPSARCYAEYVDYRQTQGHVIRDVGIEALIEWIVHRSGSVLGFLGGTEALQSRLRHLRAGCFEQHLAALRDPKSGVLHRSLVEKLLDRYATPLPPDQSATQQMEGSLLSCYLRLTPPRHLSSRADKITNPLSGMLASLEETDREAGALGCSKNDAIKRRLSRDLHHAKRQYGRPFVTAPASLMRQAEVVRVATGSPWAVEERVATAVEPHMPVMASCSIRLHSHGSGDALRPPVRTLDGEGRPTGGPTSMLIVFHADACIRDSVIAAYGAEAGFQRVFRARARARACARDRVQAGGEGPEDTSGMPLVYDLFFAEAGYHDWTYGLLASTLRMHLQHVCPLTVVDRMGAASAHLLVDRCLTRIALGRGILGGGRTFTIARPECARRVLLAVDTRLDPSATVLSIALALSSLEDPGSWAVCVLCSLLNHSACHRMLVPLLGERVSIHCDAHQLNVPPEAFSVETCYNALMKDPETWRRLLPATVVLTVQDDGLLLRAGLERLDGGRALEARIPFLGAPWADAPYNAHLKATAPGLVGNGGLSLRNVREMLRICEGLPTCERERLFHTRTEPIPEDVMFAAATCSPPGSEAEAEARSAAQAFSCEMVPYLPALGFHKPWPYWTVAQTHAHMQGLLDEEGAGHMS